MITTWVTWYPDRETARAAERRAIRYEEPIFNAARPRHSGRQVHLERQVRYLRAGTAGVLRRVPCHYVHGEFCVTCGPDAERLLEASC